MLNSPNSKLRLLLVDDDHLFGSSVRDLLAQDGVETVLAGTLRAASTLVNRPFDVVIIDRGLPDGDGLDLVRALGSRRGKVMLVTGEPGMDSAISAVRLGLDDYIVKPVNVEDLRTSILAVKSVSGGAPEASTKIYGVSDAHDRLMSRIELAARASLPVLITGETGVGKTLVAETIHRLGPTGEAAPCVKINCATLVPSLAESELFGACRGAYTGAIVDRPGLVAMANGGTLFLDEIGELPLELQAKLLSFLDDHRVRAVGDIREQMITTRVIAATNRNLHQAVQMGRFRADLFYRLAVLEIAVPPLRDRPTDIPVLAEAFLRAVSSHKEEASLAPSCIPALTRDPLPGNARELRNWVERTVVEQNGPVYNIQPSGWSHTNVTPVLASDSGPQALICPTDFGVHMTLESVEKKHIMRTIGQYPNRTKAAQCLGISEATLRRKLRSYGIGPKATAGRSWMRDGIE